MPFDFKQLASRFIPYDYRTGRMTGSNRLGGSFRVNQGGINPDVLNRLSATFNQPQLAPQQPTQPDVQPEEDKPPDFMAEYQKLMGNRPNRLAYQEAIEQGPPQIKRGIGARIGSMIAAGGAALGGESASDAANLGISTYQMPQMRSDEYYKERVKNLAAGAGMEQQDVADQIKALEMRQSDYWKSKDYGLRKSETQAQIDNIHSEMNKRDTDEWTDPSTGIKWQRDSKGNLSQIGKVALTPQEKADEEGKVASAQAQGRLPAERELEGMRTKSAADIEAMRAKSAKEIADANIAGRADVADKAAKAKVEAVKAKNRDIGNKAFKPGDVTKQLWNDLTDEFANNPDLAGEDFHDYVDVAAGPGGNSVITTKPERSIGPVTIGDNARTAGIKAIIRKTINDSLERSKAGSGGRGNVTPAAGGVNTTDKYIKDPNNPLNTIPNPNYKK